MLDRVTEGIAVPEPDPDHWMDQAKDIIRSMRDVMVAKPGIAAVAVVQIPLGPEALRVSEGLIAVLRAGGLSTKSSASRSTCCPSTPWQSRKRWWCARRSATSRPTMR